MGDVPDERTTMEKLVNEVNEYWTDQENFTRKYSKDTTTQEPGKCKICIIAKIKV